MIVPNYALCMSLHDVYPNDCLDRVLQALEKLGLISDAQGLVGFIDKHWEQIETGHVGETDDVTKRKIFSNVLERALAADLEGNIDELKNAAL